MLLIITGIAIVRTDNYIPTIREEQKMEEVEDSKDQRLLIETSNDLEFSKQFTA